MTFHTQWKRKTTTTRRMSRRKMRKTTHKERRTLTLHVAHRHNLLHTSIWKTTKP
jgi:hypothetical protein